MIDYVLPKYTEVMYNLLNNKLTKELIDKALSTYPIYISKSNHTYIPNIIPTREELNKKILDYYKYREIGFETVGRFLDELEITMNEIMPYYNQLMFTQDQDFNIIYNVDYIRNTERVLDSDSKGKTVNHTESSDSSETNSNIDTYGKNVRSDTPQNSLGIVNKDIDKVTYATEVDWSNNTSTSSSTAKGNSEGSGSSDSELAKNDIENVQEVTKGNYGVVSAQDLVMKYRETILNICQMIINDERIKELFMNVY